LFVLDFVKVKEGVPLSTNIVVVFVLHHEQRKTSSEY
jgi:hypothetical protein